MTKYQDFTTDAAIQFTGTKGDSVIEAGPVLTWRKFGKADDGRYRSSYRTLRVQGFGSLGDDGNAALFNIDEFEFESGVGLRIGYEYGRGPRKKGAKLKSTIDEVLAQARRDCIARYSVTDPLNPGTTDGAVGYRSLAAAAASSEGDKLADFMSEGSRKADYWKKIVRPLWGYDDTPSWHIGVEGSYAWTDFTYYPIYDAVSGNLLLTALPDFLRKAGEETDSKEPFALKVYGGMHLDRNEGWMKGLRFAPTVGLTYRREFGTPSSYKDQQVCVPPTQGEEANKVVAAFNQCRKINTAAPYEAEGVVASLALGFELPRYAFVPPIAFTIKPSYAFDPDRWGVEVPIYLFSEAEGKLSSGVKITCKGDGLTRSGIPLEDECGAAPFVGTKFKVGGAP